MYPMTWQHYSSSGIFPDDLPTGLPPQRPHDHMIELEPRAQPIVQRKFRLTQPELDKLRKQLEYVLEKEFIRPSSSPFTAPILFTPKKDGGFHMCIDYRTPPCARATLRPSRPAAEPPGSRAALRPSRPAARDPSRPVAEPPFCCASRPALPGEHSPTGRAIDFEVWLDDLQLFLQCDRADGLSLFDLTSGASPAPAADADPTVRSQWATRDAAARLAVLARYSSPATAALSRLMLPYLFPDLSAFPTVADLITHLRTSDTRYRAALPADLSHHPHRRPPREGPPRSGEEHRRCRSFSW
ncbi:unnamed protein product [Closterium sp. NIES-53]